MKYERQYEQLWIKEWLIDHYNNKQLSTSEIAKIVGCDTSTVLLALKRFEIERRIPANSLKIKHERIGRISKYDLLNDSQWLYQKYHIEKLSLDTIAKLVGAKTSNSVGQALRYFEIEVRSVSSGLRLQQPDDWVFEKEIIEGSLLGDGFLRRANRNSNDSYAAFYKRNKFLDHIEYVSSSLYPSVFKTRFKEETCTLKGKKFIYFLFSSFAHKELQELDNYWYPKSKNHKKIVPSNLVLTPKKILHWFLDDGSTSWRKDRSTLPVQLTFCTECFEKEDQDFLSGQLNDFGLQSRIKPYNQGTGWRIEIKPKSVETFFDLIGPPPVPSLAYKWKLPGGKYYNVANNI